jgi:para-nitrobenzyl esterase
MFMRAFIVAAALIPTFVVTSAVAQTKPTAAAPAAAQYTTADTDVGTLLDDPAARAVLDKHVPSISKSENIDMARSMTLKAMQQFAADVLTDDVLKAIDTDLAKLPAKK